MTSFQIVWLLAETKAFENSSSHFQLEIFCCRIQRIFTVKHFSQLAMLLMIWLSHAGKRVEFGTDRFQVYQKKKQQQTNCQIWAEKWYKYELAIWLLYLSQKSSVYTVIQNNFQNKCTVVFSAMYFHLNQVDLQLML